jgi:hypothetical protein
MAKTRKKVRPSRKKVAKKKRSASKPKPANEEQDIEFEALLSQLLPRQREFLVAFYDEGEIAPACRVVGISRQAHHGVWLAKDPVTQELKYPLYVQMFADARRALVELAEGQLWKMGVKGIEEPVFFQGKKTTHKITKYSVQALDRWLRANCKEKYADRSEITGAGGGPLTMTIDAARQIADNFDKRHRPRKG